MDKIIDDDLISAINIYMNKKDIPSVYQLAIEWDVPQSTIGRWLNKKTTKIKYNVWKKIEPYLQPIISKKRVSDEVPNGKEVLKVAEEFLVDEDDLVGSLYTIKEIVRLRKLVSFIPEEFQNIDSSKKPILKNLLRDLARFSKILQSTPPSNHEEEPKIINFEVSENAIPFLPQEVSAGNGVEVLEERYHQKPGMHILKIRGESMEPKYFDGDRVIVQRFIEPIIFGDEHLPLEIIKNMIPEDSIIVYNRNDTGLAIKRVKYEKGKNTWLFKLKADNREWAKDVKFSQIIKKNDNFIVYGLVVGKQN